MADARMAKRLKREEERWKLVALQQQPEQERRRREKPAQGKALIINEAESWTEAQQLRTYLPAVNEAVIAKQEAIQKGSTTHQWLTWAY